MVGIGGLEPPTSSLSETRSNQLSYMPIDIRQTDYNECIFIKMSINCNRFLEKNKIALCNGAGRQNWTADTRLFRPLLYHWATPAWPKRQTKADNIIFTCNKDAHLSSTQLKWVILSLMQFFAKYKTRKQERW